MYSELWTGCHDGHLGAKNRVSPSISGVNKLVIPLPVFYLVPRHKSLHNLRGKGLAAVRRFMNKVGYHVRRILASREVGHNSKSLGVRGLQQAWKA